ncbi:pilin [Persephonella sp.]
MGYSKHNKNGFTIVELLIVVAILAILSSMSLIMYQKYRNKSFVASHLLPIADGCSKEIIAYCIGLNVETPTVINVSSLSLKNCQDVTLSDYNLTVNVSGSFVCNPGGSVSGGTVDAEADNIPEYKAECNLLTEGIKCSVVKK